MPVIAPECPTCHTRASLAGQQPYCVKCGWNREVAIAALKQGMKIVPVVAALIAGFVAFMFSMWHFRNFVQLAIFFVVPVIGLSVNYFVMRNRLAQLERLSSDATANVTPTVAATATGPYGVGTEPSFAALFGAPFGTKSAGIAPESAVIQPDPQYQMVLSVPRPRQIRMGKRGRFSIAIVVMAVAISFTFLSIGLYIALSPTSASPTFAAKNWLLAVVGMLVLVPLAMWRAQVRERDLLQNGEIATGRVTRQWYGKNGSSITYEFKDLLGNTHSGFASDYSKKLYPGMGVTIFYDANNPKRQLAYCGTLHEIVT